MTIITGSKTLDFNKLFDDNNKQYHNYLNKKIMEDANLNRMSLQKLYGDLSFFNKRKV